MIECIDISKSYGKKRVLDSISLASRDGKIISILGPSGAGKSTLGRILSLQESPDSGSVFLDGIDILSLKGRERRKAAKSIQLIYQNPLSSFDPLWSIERSLLEGAEDREEGRKAIAALLEEADLEYVDISSYPDKLSGGEIQRLAIIRALIAEPRVIIADEVTSSLDAISRKIILDMLMRIKGKGIAVIFITHDRMAAEYISDDIIEIKGEGI